MKKRGISPLMATVLLVAIVIILIAVIIIWSRNYLEERANKEGLLSQKKLECVTDVEISIIEATSTSVTIENKKKTVNAFTIRVTGDTTDTLEPTGDLKQSETQTIEFGDRGIGEVKKIDVIPRLKVSRGIYVPCSDQHVVYNL